MGEYEVILCLSLPFKGVNLLQTSLKDGHYVLCPEGHIAEIALRCGFLFTDDADYSVRWAPLLANPFIIVGCYLVHNGTVIGHKRKYFATFTADCTRVYDPDELGCRCALIFLFDAIVFFLEGLHFILSVRLKST